MEEDYPVPARGTIQYEHFYIPTNFTEEKWLTAIEARPGNRALVHHILVFYEAPPDGPRVPPAIQPNREDSQIPRGERVPGNRPPRDTGMPSRLLATYAPGTDAQVFPAGTALRLAPGGTLHLQVHYTANGTAGTDRSKVGSDLREGAAGRRDPPGAVHQRGGSRSQRAPWIIRSRPT